MDFNVGSYVWNKSIDYGGYYKVTALSTVALTAHTYMKCLYPIGKKARFGDKIGFPILSNRLWEQGEAKGCIKWGSDGVEYTLWNLDDVVYEVPIRSTWTNVKGKTFSVIVTHFEKCKDGDNYGFIRENRNGLWKWDLFLKSFKKVKVKKTSSSSSATANTVCASCHRNYPYAEASIGFKCWGCINGY